MTREPDFIDMQGHGWYDDEPIEHTGWNECPLCGSAVMIAGGRDGYDGIGNYGAIPLSAQCTLCEYRWSE